MYTITITGEREPLLFRELLHSLIANDLAGWKIFVQLEPTPAPTQYVEIASELLGRFEYSLTVNPRPLGARETAFRLLEYVFRQGSLLNINLAGDTLVGRDTTRLAQWYFEHHRPEWMCLSLSSLARPLTFLSDVTDPGLLFAGKEFSPAGFVVCRNEWYGHFQNRNTAKESYITRREEGLLEGWEWPIYNHLLRTERLACVQPVVPRAIANRFSQRKQERAESNRALEALALARIKTADQIYRLVDPADLPDSVQAQLPVQERMQKLLAVILHGEEIIYDQNAALASVRRELSERANSLSFVLAKLLARLWCAVLPIGTRRQQLWQRYIRPLAKRLFIGKSAPLGDTSPASTPLEALRSTPASVTFQGLPQLVSREGLPVRILVLKLDHIGDFLVSIPALFHLREAWLDAQVTLVCGPWNVKLASQLGIFDEIRPFNFFWPQSGKGINGEGINRGAAEFRQLPLGDYDLAIDLRHDTETRPLLNLVRAQYRAGFVCDPQFPVRLDLAIPNLENVSALEAPRVALHSEARLITLVSAIIATFGQYFKSCNSEILIGSRSPVRYFNHGPVVALAPGTGNPIKQWGAIRFARVARALNKEAGCRFVLIGGESDKADAALVAAELPSDQYVNTVGKLDISDVPLSLAAVDLFIGNDTGTTHMAALMGIPTINIFAGTADVNIWRAKGPNVITLYTAIECAPCHFGKVEECSYGLRCLTSISEADVIASALSLLRRSDVQDTAHELRKIAAREKVAADAGSTRRLDVGSLVADQQ
jgi:ADP-heptose:LPS heptosyltransferase